ncbi:MAG: DUF86 domain-containing protein [Planctomycetota bacterium]
MTPGLVDLKIVADRASAVRTCVDLLRAKAQLSDEEFQAHPDHAAATESYLRRSLEALCDIGRHLLAKGFAEAASEYAEVAIKCGNRGLLTPDRANLFRRMVGYRNRLVHRYAEITPGELHRISQSHLQDLLDVLADLEHAARRLSAPNSS